MDSSIEEVEINGDNLMDISPEAFYGCKNLKKIILNNCSAEQLKIINTGNGGRPNPAKTAF